MTEIALLDGVLRREGGFRPATQRPNGTWDPMTYRGITSLTLGEWRKLGRPATKAELLAMPLEETLDIYRRRYIEGPGFSPDKVPFEPLREQLIDFGINSGQPLATRYLQRVIRVPVTGAMDAATVAWLHDHRGYLWLVNDALAAVRVRMIDALVDQGKMRVEDEEGVESRALDFIVTPRA